MWIGKITQVHWEPTDKCNSACPMCPRYDSKGFETKTLSNSEWTLEEFKKSWPVEFIKGLDKILACGNFGDPCACREFVDIYEYCRELHPGMGLAANTNGSLRTPDWWRRLGSVMRADQNTGNYCTFSLDGLEDTNHLYRRNTNWSKIMKNAQAFIDAGGIAHWDYIVFEHNEHQVEEARQLAKSMGFKNFNVKRTTRWQNYKDDQGFYKVYWKGEYLYDLKQPNEEKFRHNFEDAQYFKQGKYQSVTVDSLRNMLKNFKFDNKKRNADFRWVNGKWETIDLTKVSIACRAVRDAREHQPYNEIYIAADGFVAPCCFLGSEPFIDVEKRGRDENFMDLVNEQGGPDKFNIQKNNLYDILNLDIFQKWIPTTWNDPEYSKLRPRKCGSCCGVEFNNLDYGELGNKKDSYFDPKDWEKRPNE
jgi:MoaA/NifB/PqqE/SkfB family radical SAM enzyme